MLSRKPFAVVMFWNGLRAEVKQSPFVDVPILWTSQRARSDGLKPWSNVDAIQQMRPLVADVVHLESCVSSQLPLDRQRPLLDVRVARESGNDDRKELAAILSPELPVRNVDRRLHIVGIGVPHWPDPPLDLWKRAR